MAKQKPKQTPLQKEYEHELSLLKRRAKTWEKTHKILIDDFPKTPKKVTRKQIEQLKNTRISNFTEKQLQKYRENYETAYENRELSIPEEGREPYTPPTENDFYYNTDDYDDYWWEDTPNEPVQSQAEIEAFIDETIENILNTSNIARPNEAIRAILRTLLDNLRASIGDKAYYEFLSDSSTVEELTEAAQTGMATSPTKTSNGSEKQQAQDAISKFTYTLNRHSPLDSYQAEQLSEVIETEGYYGGVSFEFED